MSVCTFFGHGQCPDKIRKPLQAAVENLILSQAVDVFYVGNQGRFDALVRSVLRETAKKYPHIRYGVVLAYLPKGETEENTMFPEGLETVPPRYAIVRRNRWMLERADIVIAYITHSWGGAAQWVEKAQKQGKIVLNLANSSGTGNPSPTHPL